ncbi:MAG: hypothetical protein ACW991_01230 [Candidatus Hodarchaeales archaeon]
MTYNVKEISSSAALMIDSDLFSLLFPLFTIISVKKELAVVKRKTTIRVADKLDGIV